MPLAQTAPTPSRTHSGVQTEWVKSFALMVAGGTSITLCAERLKTPIGVLEKMFRMDHFQDELRRIGREATCDTSLKMIKGSAMDSVLVLIGIRDDDTVSAKTRVDVCKYLLDRVHGINKKGLPDTTDDISELLAKHTGSDLDTALDADIQRYISANPALAELSKRHAPPPKLSRGNSPEAVTPELGQRGTSGAGLSPITLPS